MSATMTRDEEREWAEMKEQDAIEKSKVERLLKLRIGDWTATDIKSAKRQLQDLQSGWDSLTETLDDPALLDFGNTKPVIYVGAAYSHDDEEVRRTRYDAIMRATATLVERGYPVISPVAMFYPLDEHMAGGAGTMGHEFWLPRLRTYLEVSDYFVVLRMPGWETSEGLLDELASVEDRDDIDVIYIDDVDDLKTVEFPKDRTDG